MGQGKDVGHRVRDRHRQAHPPQYRNVRKVVSNEGGIGHPYGELREDSLESRKLPGLVVLHGIFDLGLLVSAVFLMNSYDDSLALFGGLLILIDAIHSGVVMYLLFTGRTSDARGRLVVYPGQL